VISSTGRGSLLDLDLQTLKTLAAGIEGLGS
jgi:hypothetical protein